MTALIFDVDDTLYELAGPFFEAYREFFAPRCDISAKELYPVSRRYSNAAYSLALKGEIPMREVYLRRIRDAFAEFGVAVRDEEALEFQRLYAKKQGEIRLSPRMEELFFWLKPRAALGIITNGMSKQQWRKIDSLDMKRFIPREHIFVSRDVGIEKPDPRIFRHAARAMGAAEEEFYYVGDSWECDMAGAQAAGFHTVWMNKKGEKKPEDAPAPEYCAGSEEELVKILKGIAE